MTSPDTPDPPAERPLPAPVTADNPGAVTANIPAGRKADVRPTTPGDITSDWPSDIPASPTAGCSAASPTRVAAGRSAGCSVDHTVTVTVNERCIHCGTCWQFDPQHFSDGGSSAEVQRQPRGAEEVRQALLALLACPVAAIAADRAATQPLPVDGFPALVVNHASGAVYYCGWASRRSFGASSWLIVRPQGNLLIDSPRWSAPLARRIGALGGLAAIVLTHRDDVADHARWARAFGCPRWIHQADADAAPQAERRLEGQGSLQLDADLQLIPTPGHTAGSLVAVLGRERQVLFSGDHLWWNPERQVVVASERYCWWNWPEQLRSVERLLDLDVAWLLPGHGHRQAFASGAWRPALEQTLAWAGVRRTGATQPPDPA